ncbi:DUF2927 domain-containing protein [Shimia abyssi]|uniref:DUF2927 domain-containing protein n=1 Tax=Shimia abyssi TaxID=1662395 RepID=UPI000D0DDA6E|nr:DUF2927 domain-containing protein [Shimia abyssi]
MKRSAIVIGTGIGPDAINSTMLEEITQALGLLTDIDNPYYTNRSIFSQDGYSLSRIQGQDRMVLRRHYP